MNGECATCGHSAAYHGASFCMCVAGSTEKRRCDCPGWNVSRGYVALPAVMAHLREAHDIDAVECCVPEWAVKK